MRSPKKVKGEIMSPERAKESKMSLKRETVTGNARGMRKRNEMRRRRELEKEKNANENLRGEEIK